MTDTTRLSSKGQVIIPKHLRDSHQWQAGQEFLIVDTDEGILLKAKDPFPPSNLEEVAGSLHYTGPSKSLGEMEDAIRKGVSDHDDRR